MTTVELLRLSDTIDRMQAHVVNVLSRNTYKPVNEWVNVSGEANCLFSLRSVLKRELLEWIA